MRWTAVSVKKHDPLKLGEEKKIESDINYHGESSSPPIPIIPVCTPYNTVLKIQNGPPMVKSFTWRMARSLNAFAQLR